MIDSDLYTLQDSVPTAQEKAELQDAGLGEKKVIMEKDNNPITLKNALEKYFPKLEGCGGFELLRRSVIDRMLLDVIRPSPNGYTSQYMCNESGLMQAVCYVRPLQRQLSVSPLKTVLVSC